MTWANFTQIVRMKSKDAINNYRMKVKGRLKIGKFHLFLFMDQNHLAAKKSS